MWKMIGNAGQLNGLYIMQLEEKTPVVEDFLSPRNPAYYNSRIVLKSNILYFVVAQQIRTP